jgi:hypothetical protein
MLNKNPFDPKRATKGKCYHCTWPIEIYETEVFLHDKELKEHSWHAECAQNYIAELRKIDFE